MQVMPVDQQLLPLQQAGSTTAKNNGDDKSSFAGILNKALNELNNSQLKAQQAALGLVTGDIEDIHQVTIAVTEAKLAMQLAVEVRNRAIEAYQEIYRMQI